MLRGLGPGTLFSLERGLEAALAEFDRVNALARAFIEHGAAIGEWWAGVQAARQAMVNRWWPREVLEQWQRSRPEVDPAFLTVYQEPVLEEFVAAQPVAVHDAIRAWQHEDLASSAAARNVEFLASERQVLAEFFDTIEKSPLTDEQVESVVCFDNRVRVIASAGSGKTSTMVAKAAYALRREIAPAAGILMLAFNSKAAKELQERVESRVGEQSIGISAQTFHAFGLRVIGEATGRKPRVAADVVSDGGVRRVQQIVDDLRDSDAAFRRAWDLFRLVYFREIPELGEEEKPEDRDRETKTEGFRTLNGEVVRSQEERLIANWLFYNGVRYEYERSYAFDTADAEHSQYKPDFYYPDIDAYHEHWAIGPDGRPPASFHGYADGMRWKRRLHEARGTTLLETTSAGVRDGTAFEYLARELSSRGIILDENPYRDKPEEDPLDDHEIGNLVRAFLVHAKSNRLARPELVARAQTTYGLPMRVRLFLQIYDAVSAQWQDRLQRDGEIDFEDMLNQATDLIEAGRWTSPYDVVMVDEMQDSSAARARLVQALVTKPGTYLYAVGDDWQSINRFAGADLSVMTDFESWFGSGPTVWLSRTFRSPQSICDAAGSFVSENPNQIAKTVRSDQPEEPPTLKAIVVSSKKEYGSAIFSYLEELDRSQQPGKKATVYILGRYHKTSESVTEALSRDWANLDIQFSTIHAAKGKEAEYIIIPGMTRGGFPSTIADDPLLALAMPRGDTFPHAEERRLFYVALTRARRAVLMVTVTRQDSPFLLELIRKKHVVREIASGQDDDLKICPTCKVSRMVLRTGPHGQFYGCSTYPKCRGTQKPRPNRSR